MLVEAAKKLWPAYQVYSSNGTTHAVFDRHIWPVIKEIRQVLQLIDAAQAPWEGFAVGFRNEDSSYGMYAGPLPTIEAIEEYEPHFELGRPHRRCFIIYFDGEGSQHVVAEWKNDRWVGSDGL
jgi:hypothetical protein